MVKKTKKAQKTSDDALLKIITQHIEAGSDSELLAVCYSIVKVLQGACGVASQESALELCIAILEGEPLCGEDLEQLGRHLRIITESPSRGNH